MADGPAIISWNFTNWITVVLMAVVGAALIGFAASAYRNWGAN